MSAIAIALLLLVILFFLLGAGVWVAFALLGVGLSAMGIFVDAPVGQVLATTLWGHSNQWSLAALPLFIWMGEILLRSRLSDDMFRGLAPWLNRIPGKLLHVNTFGCGLFAAVSGSSAATAATIGKISIPELSKRKYPEHLIIGTLAGSATLGLLIPPSIILIVYGVATEQSISRLFVGAIIPGLMLLSLFVGYVMLRALFAPSSFPEDNQRYSFAEKLSRSRSLIPVALLILAVIGSIYSGIASPTDASAVGVALALLLSWSSGSLSWRVFIDGLMGATRTSCMIAFILLGAAFLTIAMGFTGIPRLLAQWIVTLELSTLSLLLALTVFYILLGCFLDGISVVVLSTSVIMPMVLAAGIDPLWFGIYIVLVVEMSQITPPVGFNLFVLQSLTGRNIFVIARAALPFFLLMVLALALVIAFPALVTFLPQNM